MFHLRLTPVFSRQKEALLRETSAPPLAIPAAVETCLDGFHATAALPCLTPGALWRESIRAMRPLILRAAAITIVASGCAAASTLAAMQILKAGSNLNVMVAFSVLFFAMNVISQATLLASSRLRTWVGLGAETQLVALISRKLLNLSSAAARRQSSGNLKTLITSDVRNVGQFLDNAVRNLLPSLAALAVIGPLLIHFSGLPGLAGLILMMLVIPFSMGLNAVLAHYQRKSQAELDQLTSLVGEWVKNIRLIRYLSWENAFERDVAARLRRFMTVSIIQHLLNCLLYGFSMVWWMFSAAGVIIIARVLNQPLDLVGFFGSLWLLTFMAGYLTHLPNTIRLYGLAGPSVDRIAKLLAEEDLTAQLKDGDPIPPGAAPVAIVFDDVSFSYPGTPVLRNISLEFTLDRQMAVIGEIGSGKTTLLKLLCGEIPPGSGRILVRFEDGQLRDFWTRETYKALRNSLAYVPQEAYVSSDELRTNITLSVHPGAREEDVAMAAYWAELEADLAILPDGLAQEIGEGGVNLSGGQRQRLNLARAFYSRRKYLVLDDTMSAVDTRTEKALMERLTTRTEGFVLVTHRIGELLRVPEVIVMHDGRIVERGEPQRLALNPGSQLARVLRAYENEAADE